MRSAAQPVQIQERLSAESFASLGITTPCELIDGRVVPMSPTGALHGNTELKLGRFLAEFVEQKGVGWVMSGEVGIVTRRDPDRVRGADLVFVSRERCAELPGGFLDFAPDLVVEVLSPNDRWTEVQSKLDEYFALGVIQVWIADPSTRRITVYTGPTTGEQLAPGERLRGQGALEGFELDPARVF